MRGRADPDADPREGVGSQHLDDVLQTVVPAGGTLGADAKRADGQRDVVRENQNMLRGDFIEAGSLSDRLTGEIHIGLGLHQQDLLPADAALCRQCPEADAADADVVLLRKGIRRHKACVVPGPLIAKAGVSQENHKPGDRAGGKEHLGTLPLSCQTCWRSRPLRRSGGWPRQRPARMRYS